MFMTPSDSFEDQNPLPLYFFDEAPSFEDLHATLESLNTVLAQTGNAGFYESLLTYVMQEAPWLAYKVMEDLRAKGISALENPALNQYKDRFAYNSSVSRLEV